MAIGTGPAIDRRTIIAAAVAAPLAGRAAAATPAQLFPTGPLAANPLAMTFAATPHLPAPLTTLLAAGGAARFADLTGKVRIVTLWAE